MLSSIAHTGNIAADSQAAMAPLCSMKPPATDLLWDLPETLSHFASEAAVHDAIAHAQAAAPVHPRLAPGTLPQTLPLLGPISLPS
mmetsp:Transcript_2916/g.8526  ORF Transcript_2916/g.8526 Transcript_2916/m.8526 type:complete len:86 (-) Transcript_2916:174-431(-)